MCLMSAPDVFFEVNVAWLVFFCLQKRIYVYDESGSPKADDDVSSLYTESGALSFELCTL